MAITNHSGDPSRHKAVHRLHREALANESDLISFVVEIRGMPRMTLSICAPPRGVDVYSLRRCGQSCSFEQVDGRALCLGGALGFAPLLVALSVATCVGVVTGLGVGGSATVAAGVGEVAFWDISTSISRTGELRSNLLFLRAFLICFLFFIFTLLNAGQAPVYMLATEGARPA
ncbi:hypothetical protein EVAR_64710_1 [Eumeta japonica]|uniref:Uncharacterized protein n=1 Tax=Eumeta variegata TaxID=151549 RepID=A0A4C1ZPS3_EUMVA|nr:hypothetical protein EVAR_64710_1 [Eumeta japonica]